MVFPDILTNPDPERFYNGRWLVLDIEVAKDGSIVCFTYRTANHRASFHRSLHPQFREEWHRLRADLANGDYFLVCHQVKYELSFLDLPTPILVYDTMLGQKAIHSNLRVEYSLEGVCRYYGIKGKLHHVAWLIKNEVDPADIPAQDLLRYNEQDVDQTYEVFIRQRKELKEKGLINDFYTMCLLAPVLQKIEQRGINVDEQRFRETYIRTQGEHREVLGELTELLGGANPRSAKQVRDIVFGDESTGGLGFGHSARDKSRILKTSGGLPSVSKAALSKLVPRTEKQRRFRDLKFRHSKLDGDLTKIFNKLELAVKDRSPIKFEYSQVIPSTHRLSSRGTNYAIQGQNINRDHRGIFCLDPGLCGESDYRTLEFRVAAALSNDDIGLSDILEDIDVHARSANVLTEAGQPTNRQGGKGHTFKPLFGGTTGTDAEQTYYRFFNERYSAIARTQEGWVQEVIDTGQLLMCTGMRFYWPELTWSKTGFLFQKSEIYNWYIQYIAARITQIAAIFAHYAGLTLHNTVHDSLLAKIFEEDIELFTSTIVQCQGREVYEYLYKLHGITWKVPLGVEIKVGTHWGENNKLEQKVNVI